MALIATLIEPGGVTRILFDCRNAAPKADDLERIADTIERAAPDSGRHAPGVTAAPESA